MLCPPIKNTDKFWKCGDYCSVEWLYRIISSNTLLTFGNVVGARTFDHILQILKGCIHFSEVCRRVTYIWSKLYTLGNVQRVM